MPIIRSKAAYAPNDEPNSLPPSACLCRHRLGLSPAAFVGAGKIYYVKPDLDVYSGNCGFETAECKDFRFGHCGPNLSLAKLKRIMSIDTDNKTESTSTQAPIDQLINPIIRFLHVEAASGVILLLASIFALITANSPYSEGFLNFWQIPISLHFGALNLQLSLKLFINDALMAIFFYVVGLEVKRELVLGELKEFRRAALPVAAAIGGMVVSCGPFSAACKPASREREAGAYQWPRTLPLS